MRDSTGSGPIQPRSPDWSDRMRSNVVISQFELSEARSNSTNLASYRLLDPMKPWFLVGVDGDWDLLAMISASEPTDWDQKVSILSIRHGRINADIEGWEGGAFQIRYPSSERARVATFVSDLCHRVDPEDPVDSSMQIIDEWSDLWSRVRGPMGPESQRGLFGELICLRDMVGSLGADSLSNWEGPNRSPQDFVGEGWRVEVKTVGTQIARPRISSFDQLLPSDGHSLHLLLISIKSGTDVSLNGLVDDCRGIFKGKKRQDFERLIHQAGYYDKHREHYARTYDLVGISSLEITNNTKVLNRNMLSTDIPSIEKVEWVLKTEELPFEDLPDDFWSTL